MIKVSCCIPLALASFLVGCGESAPSSSCENFIVSEYRSPASEMKAVFFERRCKKIMQFGEFSTSHASILPASTELGNEEGNVLIIKDGWANKGVWSSENTVEIDYFGTPTLLKQTYDNIKIVTHNQTAK